MNKGLIKNFPSRFLRTATSRLLGSNVDDVRQSKRHASVQHKSIPSRCPIPSGGYHVGKYGLFVASAKPVGEHGSNDYGPVDQ